MSEHTTEAERIIWDEVFRSRLREGNFAEGPMDAPTCLEAFASRLLAERDALAKRVAELEEVLGSFDKQCADALADEVAVLIQRGKLDARSPAGDALLDYRNPPQSPRSDRLAALEVENAKLSEQKAQLIIQAQSHKIEARGQRATVHQVNQVVSGARGEKGDWNGAVPVRDRIAELTERAEKAEAEVKELERWERFRRDMAEEEEYEQRCGK